MSKGFFGSEIEEILKVPAQKSILTISKSFKETYNYFLHLFKSNFAIDKVKLTCHVFFNLIAFLQHVTGV